MHESMDRDDARRVAAGTVIVGPGAASLVHVRGRYPDGGAIVVDVLLLADLHTPSQEPRSATNDAADKFLIDTDSAAGAMDDAVPM